MIDDEYRLPVHVHSAISLVSPEQDAHECRSSEAVQRHDRATPVSESRRRATRGKRRPAGATSRRSTSNRQASRAATHAGSGEVAPSRTRSRDPTQAGGARSDAAKAYAAAWDAAIDEPNGANHKSSLLDQQRDREPWRGARVVVAFWFGRVVEHRRVSAIENAIVSPRRCVQDWGRWPRG
jgi:hypothetical protein